MPIAPPGRGPGPRRSGLLVLAAAAFAFLATSQSLPTLETSADGEVSLGPGAIVEHAVRVHLDLAAVEGAGRSSLRIGFRSGSDLDVGYASWATATLSRAGAPADTSDLGGLSLPTDDCPSGCDLDYVAQFEAGPSVLPGSVARYRVDLVIEYPASFGEHPASQATIVLEHPASGPAPAWWSVLTGVLGLVVGWVLAPRLDEALGRRRRWPAIALAVVPVGILVVVALQRVAVVLPYGAQLASGIFYLIEPWSLALLGTLTWGVIHGLRRWEADGGWALGLGAVALTGLGGLWLAWWTTLDPVGQPIVAAVAAAVLGILAGSVIGQGWRLDPRAFHDRGVAGAAVLSHGVVIAGFGFVAVDSLDDPFGNASALLALVPAAFIALALRRWFSGGRAWLVLFDLLVAGVGLLGFVVVVLPGSSSLGSLGREPIADLAVSVAVGASLVALVTAFHQMPGPDGPAEPTMAEPVVSPDAPPVASPPTS